VRILHVGWGFTPWRSGGLILYAEDLMAAQVARGHDVGYFFSGRQYPYIPGPRLHRWRRDGVAMRELLNSRVVVGMEHGTRDPWRELSEPGAERAFRRVLRWFRPDVVHIQELLGLPSALIDVAAAAGRPTLMTLQDYQPLCATLRLMDSDGRICTRLEVGEDCVAGNADAPRTNWIPYDATIEFERERLSFEPRIRDRVIDRMDRHGPFTAPAPRAPLDEPLVAGFQRRRDVNVARLSRVNRLIAQSPRVAELYRTRGVSGERLGTLPFTLRHIERLVPRALDEPPSRITFATLGGCASETKGLNLVLTALRTLRAAGLEGAFGLRIFGTVPGSDVPELEDYEGVELRGPYRREQLDALLDEVDVGIMPSIWEEAFGYSGLEMIAKAIPLIANPLGGMVEYALEGRTAWHNRACSGEGLAELMSMLIAAPERVLEMHRRVLAERDRLIVPMSEHVDAMEAAYREAIAAQSSNVR